MGWTFSNWTRAELIEHLTQPGETDTARYETLRFAIRGDVLWQVIRYTSKEPAVIEMVADHSFNIIGCTLLERSSGWWGYKAMVEQAHPYYYSCPLKYLAMAPERCPEWREGVREYHAGRRVSNHRPTRLTAQQAAFA